MQKYMLIATCLMTSNCFTMDRVSPQEMKSLCDRIVALEVAVRTTIPALKDRIDILEKEVHVAQGKPGARSLVLTEQATAQNYKLLDQNAKKQSSTVKEEPKSHP